MILFTSCRTVCYLTFELVEWAMLGMAIPFLYTRFCLTNQPKRLLAAENEPSKPVSRFSSWWCVTSFFPPLTFPVEIAIATLASNSRVIFSLSCLRYLPQVHLSRHSPGERPGVSYLLECLPRRAPLRDVFHALNLPCPTTLGSSPAKAAPF